MKLTFLTASLGVVSGQYDYSDLVLMSEYSQNYRTLNVWECFEARGKFCHDKTYQSMMMVSGSSNRGHGICCKPDFNGEHCSPSDENHDCSMPAEITDPDSEYVHILSPGHLNYQMFAFNPTVNQRECGIADSDSNDMTLVATAEKKVLSTDQLKYREGRPDYRQYDACFYLIKPESASTEGDGVQAGEVGTPSVTITVKKADQMNIYLYGGADRFGAFKAMVINNQPAKVDVTYGWAKESGVMVVAFPNKDVDTALEFEYSIDENFI